ncbi:MAG: type II toxin-antitoxin system Phd/YefM family antitoxin [Defluviitaleaceae bacterium]|nr:type II toxin-antitoxin system Phd/YefM family antitoxin [Defluviitaleaceae bacterium]
MRHVNAVVARRDFDGILDTVIELGEPVSIATDKGTAILICQEDWHGLMETIYLQSVPGIVDSIKLAQAAQASERLEDIGWDIN